MNLGRRIESIIEILWKSIESKNNLGCKEPLAIFWSNPPSWLQRSGLIHITVCGSAMCIRPVKCFSIKEFCMIVELWKYCTVWKELLETWKTRMFLASIFQRKKKKKKKSMWHYSFSRHLVHTIVLLA